MDDQIETAGFVRQPLGPASRSICKVTTRGVCGSGSIVGERNGRTLVLTNAHVAGSRPGKQVTCEFPELQSRRVSARIIMAAYSDRIMMDWAVLECDELLPLKVYKLNKDAPTGEHYTGGYPRCRGPYYQRLITQRFTHRGTVWRWQPISVGGQSGSGVHSLASHLQYGLLTWSWGGDGAGQTAYGIWLQYRDRAERGFARPEGLTELADNRADDLEVGFYQQTDITTLPIWSHLDEPPAPDPDEPDTPVPPAFVQGIKARARKLHDQATDLMEFARSYEPPRDDTDDQEDDAPLFDL